MRAHNLLCLVFATFRYFYCNFCQLVWHDEKDKQAKEFLTPQTSINSVLPTQCPQRVPLPIPGCGSTGPEQCNMPNVSRNLIKHFLRLFVYTDIPLSLSLPLPLPFLLSLSLSPPQSNLPQTICTQTVQASRRLVWPIDFRTCSDVCVWGEGKGIGQKRSRSWRRLLTYFNNYLQKALVSLQFGFPSPQLHPWVHPSQ